jgi:ABC-type multidrug transport system fused ATPase/permease subunit
VTLRDAVNDFAVDFGLVEDRAGRYARRLAWSRVWAFVKSCWKRLLVVLVLGVAAVFFTALLPRWTRGFIAGAWLASVAWVLILLVLQSSGTTATMMGGIAEQWTSQELRDLRRRGWRVLSHIMPTFGDIDHIAVGPGGLIVVETKWASHPAALDDRSRVEAACRQVEENARKVRLALKNRLQGAPVRSVVVYWGPGVVTKAQLPGPVEEDGVTVLPGPILRRWLGSISDAPSVVVDAVAVDSAWQTLTKIAQDTDSRELGTDFETRRTPLRHLVDAGIGLTTGMAAFAGACLLLGCLGIAICVPVLAVMCGLGLAICLVERSNSTRRMFGLGLAVGCASCLVLLAVLYGYSALIH